MSSAVAEIEKLYESPGPDLEFADVLSSSQAADDAALAELIEADGRLRIARHRPVTLERYFRAVADLRARPDALDAAIDVALRSLAGGARINDGAVEELVGMHPDLEEPIREAATLNAAVWSTTGLQAHVAPRPAKPLPCDFGPIMSDRNRRYQLQKLLGQGAFGQVYLALDRQLSEEGHTAMVAIKVLAARDRSPWARQAMIDEATKVRRISHPNVVLVMDRGLTEENEDYIVYEFVDGGDLSQLTAQHAPLPIQEAARLMAQIARGVHAAHSAGVIHCDLKPGNIMMTSAGQPKVADFGIAVRLTDGHGRGRQAASDEHAPVGPMGNLAFVSPEQYRGEPDAISIPSDVYALGGILFMLLTGSLPNGSTPEEIARTHDPRAGRAQPPFVRRLRPEVGRDLEAICRRALAVDRQARYSSAAAMAEDLERWLRWEPLVWRRPGVIRVLSLWARRKPALAVAVALISALLMGVTVVVANLRAEQREKASKQAYTERFVIGLKAMKSDDYRLNTEIFPVVWVLEWFYGPTVLGAPDRGADSWMMRIAKVRNLVRGAHAAGRGDEVQTLWWESALAFWLVCDKDCDEAIPLLDQNLAKWRAMTTANDSWLLSLEALRHCATVNCLIAQAASSGAPPDQVRAVKAQLVDDEQWIAGLYRGTPLHFAVLQSLIDLCQPGLLNDPARAESLAAQRKSLIDDTVVAALRKPPASAPASAATAPAQ